MHVKIRGVDIYLENMDELDMLLEKYGSEIAIGEDANPEPKSKHKQAAGSSSTHDRVILSRFVEAGSTGVETNELGKLLGKMGRGTRNAAKQWALRVGLINSDSVDPFEECRVGSKRGLKIETAHLSVAKELMG